MPTTLHHAIVASILIVMAMHGQVFAKENIDHRVQQLEALTSNLQAEVNKISQLEERPSSRFIFGGYGEIHATFTEGDSKDFLDIHRLVAFVGYSFNDWIQFQSEVEIEHAFVADGGGGELEIEQAFVDFLLSDMANIRAGRVLAPLEIISQHHEPNTFNGVERPNFSKYIIPTTWWSDGIGLFGNLADTLNYELYLIGGLDGSGFSDTDGIRGGRIKERPSLNDMALTGRLDYFPFLGRFQGGLQKTRLGLSFLSGGIDNGNKGKDPGIDGDISIYSADFSTGAGRLDLRGVVAYEKIDGAENIGNNVAEEIFGFYLETAYHILPLRWKHGKLKNADAVIFVRYDDYDTQYGMPGDIEQNPAGDRYDWTFGLSFFPTTNLVVKADYQVRKSAADSDPADTFNLGLGWQF